MIWKLKNVRISILKWISWIIPWNKNFEQVHNSHQKKRREKTKSGQVNETKHGKHNAEIKTKQNKTDTKHQQQQQKVNNGEPLFVINAKYTNMNCSAVDDVLISELELWQWNESEREKKKITPILLSTEFIPSYNENTLIHTFICCSTLCFVWSN